MIFKDSKNGEGLNIESTQHYFFALILFSFKYL